MGSLWNRSGTVERYADDIRAAGAKAYFFTGGTTTALTVFQDAGASAAHPHPLLADANGRWPDVFVPYILAYDVQVTDANNVQLTFTQNIPNPDPVDLTVTVDPLNTVQTGMIHAEFVNTTKTGYVRLNGRTIGSATSVATERANADTSTLFAYLWNNLTDAVAPVSSGRGGSAAVDFAANKTITLPDMRGTTMAGLDDMGSTAAGAYAAQTFSVGSAIIAAGLAGANAKTLATANIPAHTHTGSTSSDGSHAHGGAYTTSTEFPAHAHTGTTDSAATQHTHTGITDAHVHTIPALTTLGGFASGGGLTAVTGYTAGTGGPNTSSVSVGLNTTPGEGAPHTHTFTSNAESALHTHTFTITSDGTHSHTFTTSSVGSGTAFDNMPLVRMVTWFIKL